MKKLIEKKEILMAIVMVLIFAISSTVYATGTSNSPIQIPTINTNTNTTDDSTPIETTNTPTNVITPTTNTNTTTSTYENTTLPQTGDASDYAIFLLIVASAIIAVYAYKKVRDYNI